MAGRWYRERQGKSPAVPESDLVDLAIQSLGLDDVSPFDPARKIIEHRFHDAPGFAGRTVAGFVDDVAADTPAPGGGSVAALFASLAAALAAMVAGITYPRKDAEVHRASLASLGARAQELKARLLASIQEDADAFDGMMAARRLKGASPEERSAKEGAVQAATVRAIEVPLSVVRGSADVLKVAHEVARIGAASALSDIGVAALAALAAAEGAFDNVVINLSGVSDGARARDLRREAEAALERARVASAAIRAQVERELRAAAP
jgi:glutamate formiminotransferase/formiminotetrahydrofolate cyclodeaminase